VRVPDVAYGSSATLLVIQELEWKPWILLPV
jgi:hypothetical protein